MVTVMLLGPITAPDVVLKVALICVGLTTTTDPKATVRPFAGATTLTVDPAVKLLPVRTTATGFGLPNVRRRPELGVIELRTGVPGFTTVNVTGVVGAPVVVTVTFLAVNAAVGEMTKFAVMVVSLTTVKALTVMPPPVTAIPVAGLAPLTKLMPVSVTGCVVPRAPVVGAIENSPAGGTVTVKVTALLVPAPVVTVTFEAPAGANGAMFTIAVMEVSLATVKPVTLIPKFEKLTEVAPVRPDPVSVTVRPVVPRFAEAGATVVSTGPLMANGSVLLAPPAVTTSIFTLPIGVLRLLLKVAVMVFRLTTITLLIEKPATAGVATTVAPFTKFVPVSVTPTDEPRISEFGVMDVNVGPAGTVTVKVTALLVPDGVVTVTFLAPNVAVGEMVKVAVTVVALTAAKLVTVMPPPLTFTALAKVRPVPVIVTGTTVPWLPLLGEIEASVAVPVVFWNSTAPTSKWFGLPGSGRGFPKKSRDRAGTVPVGRVVELSGT